MSDNYLWEVWIAMLLFSFWQIITSYDTSDTWKQFYWYDIVNENLAISTRGLLVNADFYG